LGWQHDVPERQTEAPGQVPQFKVLPQPSFTLPQTFPAQDALGAQQVLSVLQNCPDGHEPHCNVPPQPSGIVPHDVAPHVFGTQQVLFVLQVCPEGHEPHCNVPPQPSENVPHDVAPHVFGTQAWQTFVMP
jgi:hypothetical protein